jgi:molecular chaperone DnaK
MVNRFRIAHGIDLGGDKIAVQRLSQAGETAAIELLRSESQEETTVNLPFITVTPDGPLDLELTLSRAELLRWLSQK